jgi:osmoprotectant transport system substrate-binding protein
VSVLAAAPAQDRNEVAVTAATARAFGLRTISDLQTHADEMIFGGPPECQDRPFCLPGLARVYGLHFSSFLALDAGGPLTLQALRTGAVDAAVVFSSDGATARAGLVLLRDDRGLQPAENVTPVVATSALVTAGPRLAATVNAVSAQLTDEDLRTMNAQVAVDEIPAAQVAATWLREHGLAE